MVGTRRERRSAFEAELVASRSGGGVGARGSRPSDDAARGAGRARRTVDERSELEAGLRLPGAAASEAGEFRASRAPRSGAADFTRPGKRPRRESRYLKRARAVRRTG